MKIELLLLVCCFPQVLFGQGSVFNDERSHDGFYGFKRDSILCLVDSTSTLQYEDISRPDILSKFRPLSEIFPGYSYFNCQGITNQNCYTIWTIGRVPNPLPGKQLFYYRCFYFRGDHTTLYIRRGGDSVEIFHAGFLNPLSNQTTEQQRLGRISREFKPVAPLVLRHGEVVTVVSKINHYSTDNLLIVPTMMTRDYFLESQGNYFANQRKGFFLQGMLWILFLFNFVIFLLNRIRAFFWLAGYNFCMAFIFIYLDGLNAVFFPEHPLYSYYALTLAVAATPGFYSAFIFAFLDIRKTLPRFAPVFKFGMWSSLGTFILTLLFFCISTNWQFWDNLIYYFITIPLALLAVFIFYAIRQKKKMYYFFLVGNGFLLIGAGLYFLYNSDSMPGVKFRLAFPDLQIGDVFQYAIIAEMLTFAAGLGYQMLNAEKEKTRLEAVSEIKGRLYTNITHEFRTPLTIIMGMLEQIKGYDMERQLIRRNSENLLRLVNQLLDLSKIDSGKMAFNWVTGDIVQYVRYLSESFSSMAAEKDISFQFKSEASPIEMDFDEVKLQQIIYNLISNALKFTPVGGVVSVAVSRLKISGTPFIKMSVEDNGIGISRDQLPYIFDRFFQAGKSEIKKGEGTGIGLTLTRELVELLKGTLSVESEPGAGSTFSVLLPIKRQAAIAYKQDTEPEFLHLQQVISVDGGSGEPAANPDLPHLLLVEDNLEVGNFIHTLLQEQYHIIRAENGQQGVDLALENIPDIIISDVMMPEKDGYEVCQILKSDERTSHIPIILLTAKAEQKDKVTGLQQGADAYLLKPFDKAELFIRLEKLLELRKTLRAKYSSSEAFKPASDKNQPPTLEDLFLQKIREAIEDRIDDSEFSIPDLCRAMLLSNMQLYRKLKALTGKTPTLFIRSYRLHKAMELLKTTDLNISEIAYSTGFSNPAYFSRAFREEFDKAPIDFRK